VAVEEALVVAVVAMVVVGPLTAAAVVEAITEPLVAAGTGEDTVRVRRATGRTSVAMVPAKGNMSVWHGWHKAKLRGRVI
jgi:hypothetical protein